MIHLTLCVYFVNLTLMLGHAGFLKRVGFEVSSYVVFWKYFFLRITVHSGRRRTQGLTKEVQKIHGQVLTAN